MSRLYEIVENGKFDRLIPQIALTNGAGVAQEGSGRITWDIEAGIRFEGATKSENEDVIAAFDFLSAIVPEISGTRLKLCGTSQQGEVISSDELYEREFGLNSGTDFRIWDVELHSFTIEEQIHFANQGRVTACFRAVKNLCFARETITDNDNPFFGGRRKTFDWLAFYCGYGRVIVKRTTGGMVRVLVHTKDEAMDHERWLDSIRLALSFAEGRSIQLIGYETAQDEVRKIKLIRQFRTSKYDFGSPVKNGPLTHHENLLGCCANFFHTEKGRRFSDSLRMCWDVADNYPTVKALVACSAIEALIDLLKNRKEVARTATEQQVEEQARLILNLRENAELYGERFVKRVSGLLNDKSKVDVKFVLDDWARRGIMKIQRDDVAAWRDLRNPASHGSILFNVFHDNSIVENQRKLARVHNLLNKLTFQAVGYSGHFYDHCDHVSDKFILAPADAL